MACVEIESLTKRQEPAAVRRALQVKVFRSFTTHINLWLVCDPTFGRAASDNVNISTEHRTYHHYLHPPPATCFGVITAGVAELFIGSWGVGDSRCYPSSTVSNDGGVVDYWSPGICPSGYSNACSYTSFDLTSSPTTTASVCCPT